MKTDTASLRNMAKSELSEQDYARKLCNEAADEIEMLREKLFWKNRYHLTRERFLENSIKFQSDLAEILEQDMEESKSIIQSNLATLRFAIGDKIKDLGIGEAYATIVTITDRPNGK